MIEVMRMTPRRLAIGMSLWVPNLFSGIRVRRLVHRRAGRFVLRPGVGTFQTPHPFFESIRRIGAKRADAAELRHDRNQGLQALDRAFG